MKTERSISLLVSRLKKWATLRNVVIALALFGFNGLLLGRLDQPLMKLAGGEPKLDLRFGYDLGTVQRLMDAYGVEGRSLYAWNLAADTPFPILGAIAVSLFALVAFSNPRWQKFLILPLLIFGVADLIENALLFSIVQGYPSLQPALVAVTSVITQVKRTAYYASALVLILSVFMVAVMQLRHQQSSSSSG
jgi:hypothetical protein